MNLRTTLNVTSVQNTGETGDIHSSSGKVKTESRQYHLKGKRDGYLRKNSFCLQLSSDVSGRNAETKVRGRLKEKESEEREKRENEDKLRKELTSKYEKWNKG